MGTILKVTPQLNGSDTVILKIELESSNLAASVAGAVDLITNKRTFSTNVMIEDGGIVVLGGLIQDTSPQGEQRVPFLGRIPIIGLAFKTRNAQKTRNNLMVFIRPKILRDGVQTAVRDGREVQLHPRRAEEAEQDRRSCRSCRARRSRCSIRRRRLHRRARVKSTRASNRRSCVAARAMPRRKTQQPQLPDGTLRRQPSARRHLRTPPAPPCGRRQTPPRWPPRAQAREERARWMTLSPP